jgi:hypothetical protein
MAVSLVSPRALIDLFDGLSDDHKDEFSALLARRWSEAALIKLYYYMTPIQQRRFVDAVITKTAENFLPALVKEMVKDAQAKGKVFTDEEIEKGMDFVTTLWRDKEERLKAELKAHRDRKTDPENAARNHEICELRQKDKKRWTVRTLAEKYDLDQSYLRRILTRCAEWKRLAEKGTN